MRRRGGLPSTRCHARGRVRRPGTSARSRRNCSGYAPASPAPNAKRTNSRTKKFETAPVRLVKTDHHATMRVSTLSRADAVRHGAARNFKSRVGQREEPDHPSPLFWDSGSRSCLHARAGDRDADAIEVRNDRQEKKQAKYAMTIAHSLVIESF